MAAWQVSGEQMMARLAERRNGAPLRCESCGYGVWAPGAVDWQAHQGPGTASEEDEAGTAVLLVLYCRNCGLAKTFNLVLLGLVPDSSGTWHAQPPDAPRLVFGPGSPAASQPPIMDPAEKLLGTVFPDDPGQSGQR